MSKVDLDSGMAEDASNIRSFFREHEQFFAMLEKAVDTTSDRSTWNTSSIPADEHRVFKELTNILEQYQEQPTCLDPYLEKIVGRLSSVAQEYIYEYHDNIVAMDTQQTAEPQSLVAMNRMAGIFDLLYTLTKVRGSKTVMRFFPHEVADVEPVFTTLWRHTSQLGVSSWTTRYILLIWLSLLAMVPFDIESIDSGITNLPPLDPKNKHAVSTGVASNKEVLVHKWVELGKFYLSRPGCEMEGAAIMLSRLLTRQDTASTLQPAFVEWAVGEITDAMNSSSSPSATSKPNASNEISLKPSLSISSVLRINGSLRVLCHLLAAMNSADSLQHQLEPLLEILQSEAFEQHTLTRKLTTKAAQRLALLILPSTSVVSAIRNQMAVDPDSSAHGDNEQSDNEPDVEIPEEVELFIGILIQKLHDKIPKEETFGSMDGGEPIDVSMTSEFAWHGALLALAELSRKGLISPQALFKIVPWVVRGLTYEIQRGDYSVGSNVRDAACYVMWSFARMPNPASRQVLIDLSTEIATTLISVAVFDREPNVRRAASAAFQEHVGRHSSFPHGIAVLQLADFFSVGNMRNAFVVSSRQIGAYIEYREPLLRHLCTVTIYHWDIKARELAAAALRELVPLAPGFVKSSLLPDIAVLSVTSGLPARYLEDFGAPLTLEALVTYMGCLSRARLSISGVEAQQAYFSIFVQAFTACRDARNFVPEFEAFVDAFGVTAEQHNMICELTQVQKSGTSRENFTLALGALRGQGVLDLLYKLVTEGATVEVHRNASIALGYIYQRANSDGLDLLEGNTDTIIGALLDGLLDHTVDNRGDVGSWVRIQSLHSLAAMFGNDTGLFAKLSSNKELFLRLLVRVLHATTEKIDNLRLAAGSLLEMLLFKQLQPLDVDPQTIACLDCLRNVLHAERENEAVDKSDKDGSNTNINWSDSREAFSRIAFALSVPIDELRQALFEGLVVAGSAEPLGKYAVAAVADYIESLSASAADEVTAAVSSGGSCDAKNYAGSGWSVDSMVAEMTRLLLTDRRTSKLINPALIVADQLIEQGSFQTASTDRLMLCLKLYSSMALLSEDITKLATESLLAHMSHAIPKIRQVAADQMYTMLCINGLAIQSDDESMEEIDRLLTDTEWMREDAGVKQARVSLARLAREVMTLKPPAA
ncbi:hypothetical protein GGI07_000886 [Coemansia sp. Benny D115]|nr:hypothetical protein GGI07_000886 [Coemansia sp. Benny D115]